MQQVGIERVDACRIALEGANATPLPSIRFRRVVPLLERARHRLAEPIAKEFSLARIVALVGNEHRLACLLEDRQVAESNARRDGVIDALPYTLAASLHGRTRHEGHAEVEMHDVELAQRPPEHAQP